MYLDLKSACQKILLKLKVRIVSSQLPLLADGWCQMSMLTPCEMYFGLMKYATDTTYLMEK